MYRYFSSVYFALAFFFHALFLVAIYTECRKTGE